MKSGQLLYWIVGLIYLIFPNELLPQVAYITQPGEGTVSVINTATNTVIKTIDLGATPSNIAASADGCLVFVGHEGHPHVSVIEALSFTEIATLGVESPIPGISFNPGTNNLYVANSGQIGISVFSVDYNTGAFNSGHGNTGSFNFGAANTGIANSGDYNTGIANSGNVNTGAFNLRLDETTSSSDLVNTHALNKKLVNPSPQIRTKSHNFMEPSETSATTLNSSILYVTNYESGTVTIIDGLTNMPIAVIDVGGTPEGVVFHPAYNRVYVTNYSDNDVHVIDAENNMLLVDIGVGLGPRGIAVNPSGSRVYVANHDSNDVSVIDAMTNLVVATIPVGVEPHGISILGDGNDSRIYVANYGSDNVSVIDAETNMVIKSISDINGPRSFGIFVAPICIPDAVPSLSQWGMIILSLSMLITGTVCLSPRLIYN